MTLRGIIMCDYMIKKGANLELEIYGIHNIKDEPSRIMCMHDRHFYEEQLTDEFEEDGEQFYVFSVTALECPSIPCGIGMIVNTKYVIKL